MGASRPQTPRCFLVLDYLFSSTRKLQFYVELARTFDPIEDPLINSKIDIYSKYVTVYGIDSAFMDKFEDNGYPVIDEENEIYPLTLLIDSSLPDGTIKLSHHDDDDDDEEEDLVPEKPKFEFLING